MPRLVAECAEQWSLELEEPIDTPHSLVVPAGDVVLKLNAPSHFEADTEADALERWGGRGAVRLLARDDARQHCSSSAASRERSSGTRASTKRQSSPELLPRLQIPSPRHPSRSGCSPPRPTAGPTTFRADTRPPAGRSSARCSTLALDVYRTVDRSAALLVNQDLHGGNSSRAAREPWLVIDPKPLVGERELEASGLLRNADVDVVAAGSTLARRRVGFDRERARGWGVAHNLAWAWDERDGWLVGPRRRGARILNAR